jgi:DNA polymerase-3 subunit alpha
MGKKKKELIKQEFDRYFPRACQHMSEAHAREIWEQLQEFSLYGFNKSHAVEYGIILLWTIYAKHYYPREFLLASIRTVDKDKKSRYIQEAQRLGIEVSIPRLR